MSNPRILFLDDSLERQRTFRSLVPSGHCVQTADECIAALERSWDVVFLDHDLGGEVFVDPAHPNSGSAVVRWMVTHSPAVGYIIVHSLNGAAARLMVAALREVGYRADHVPFAWASAHLIVS